MPAVESGTRRRAGHRGRVSDEPPGYGRSARDRLAHNKHYYAGGVVLRNLPDLRTSEELDRFERFAVANASLSRAPMHAFTSDEFKAIHRHLFGDLYAWAGQVRDYATGRGDAPRLCSCSVRDS